MPSYPINLRRTPHAILSVARQAGLLIAQVWTAWREDYALSTGAALAYYTLFSHAPLLLIVTSVSGER